MDKPFWTWTYIDQKMEKYTVATKEFEDVFLGRNMNGWWLSHSSEKYESQFGWLFPIYGKITPVPNHQTVKIHQQHLVPSRSQWCFIGDAHNLHLQHMTWSSFLLGNTYLHSKENLRRNMEQSPGLYIPTSQKLWIAMVFAVIYLLKHPNKSNVFWIN